MNFTVTIQNLKCGGCAHTIVSKVSALENVTDVTVDLESSSVSGTIKSSHDLENIKKKLAVIGYPEEGENNSIVSKAKSFVSCATGKMTS